MFVVVMTVSSFNVFSYLTKNCYITRFSVQMITGSGWYLCLICLAPNL